MYSEKKNLDLMLNIISNSHQIEVMIDLCYYKLDKLKLEKRQWLPSKPGTSNLSSKQGLSTSLKHLERIESESDEIWRELEVYQNDLLEMDNFLERLSRKKEHRFLIYRYRHNMTFKEIAGQVNSSESFVQKKIKKIMEKLEGE